LGTVCTEALGNWEHCRLGGALGVLGALAALGALWVLGHQGLNFGKLGALRGLEAPRVLVALGHSGHCRADVMGNTGSTGALRTVRTLGALGTGSPRGQDMSKSGTNTLSDCELAICVNPLVECRESRTPMLDSRPRNYKKMYLPCFQIWPKISI
jgi:hypothetical protein